MKDTIKRLTAGATRLLVLALGLGLVSTGWAEVPTPAVVWDGAASEYDFNELTRSGYTINPAVSSRTVSTIGGDGAYIQIGNGDGIAGVSITNPTSGSFGSGGTTVIIRYSDLIKMASNRALIALMDGDEFSDSSTDATKKNHAKVGLGQSNGSYGEAVFINGGGVDTYLKGSFAEGMQTLAFVCNSSQMAFYVNGNYRTNRAHSYGSITPTGIMLGGLDVDNSGKFYALKNLKIYAVAIFDSELTAAEIAAYKFPASDSGTPAKWQYANYMLTWQTPDTASTGNMSVNSSIFQYYDNYLNQEKTTTVPGGTAWPWFCYGQQLRNPGVVLRLKNGSYYKTLGGDFDNCTFAGLKVDSDASGYKIEQTDNASRRGTRLGDVSGNAETWFEIGSSFSIMRTGSFYLSGIVNIDIADDAVLSLNDGIENITNGSVSHYPAICASVDSSVVSGGALKMHGEGQLKTTKLTATGSKLDYSDLENRANTDPFLDVSTLVIDANTTFAFPANAKLPYQLVSGAISGNLSASDVTYSVGAVEYTGKLTKAADGQSVYYPVSTTISADAAWATLTWNAELPDSGVESLDYIVNVVSDSELNIGGSERTVNKVTFNVAENATLTLTGSALTASDSIYITGKGAVKVTSGGALKGTVKGNGTVMYSGVLPASSGVTLNDSAWRGTVWIYNYGSINSSGVVGNNLSTGSANSQEMANWGNENSYVKFTLVKAYAPNANVTCPYTLVLEDGEGAADYAWRCDDGFSTQSLKFKALEGDGTFYDIGGVTAPFTFLSAADFRGTFYIWHDSSAGHKILIGDNASYDTAGSVAIGSGQTVTINKAWTIRNNFKVDGTVNVNAEIITGYQGILVYGTVNYDANIAKPTTVYNGGTLNVNAADSGSITVNSGGVANIAANVTGAISVAGSVNIKETVSAKFSSISGTLTVDADKILTLTGNTDSLNYSGSGTVNVYGTLNMDTTRWTIGSSNIINLYEGGTISGTGESTYGALDWYNAGTLNVYGTSTISANMRCRDSGNLSFNVASGTCTFSGESYGARPITKTGAGTLKIAYAGSSSYNLPSLGAGTIEFASGTWNLNAVRSLAGYTMTDGGTAIVKVAQTAEEYAKGVDITVSDIDSSIGEITVVPVVGSEETLTVSGASVTYSGSGTITVGGKACTFDWEFNGNLNSVGYNTTSLSGSSAFDADNQVLYVRSTPYYDGSWTWADNWTVAIKSTMPARGKDIVIAFGTKTGGIVALITSPNAGKVKLVRTTSDVAATDISEMTVADRSGVQHLYLFSKTSDGRMQVYCDDTLIDDKVVNEISSLPGTLQIGSIHGAKGNSGLTSPESTDNAAIDFLQVYNYEISDAMRNKIITDYAWVNPNKYTRTVSGDESLSSSDAWNKPSDSSTVALPVTDADAIITTSTSSAALTVNADFEADTLTINSGADGAALRIKAGTGTLSAAKVAVNAPVTIEYGAVDFSGSVVTFGEGGSLTYDFSGVAINSRTTRLVAKLTGLVEAPADLSDSSTWPVQVITHSDAASLADYYESTFSYDTDASAYYYVCGPDHDWGSEVYYTGGYWSSNSGNTISVTNAAGATTKVFDGDTVVIPAYYPNATTWSDNTLPANVTKIRVSKSKIKVCSGANSGDIFTGVTWTVDSGCVLWFGVDAKTTSLGAMTINGSGSVECGNITINGTISGNAPVKILDNVTTRLTATGSIATSHIISGGASATIAVAKTTPISERMTFGAWTGTVTLPENFNANSEGVDFHYYGKSGSTIEINGFTGWLKTGETYSGAGTYGRQVNPHLKLNGNMSITGLSATWYDIIGGISGSGNFSLASSNKPSGDSFWISKVSDYTGSIVNNTTGSAETTIVIKELVADSFVGGAKLLSRGGVGPLSISKVTVDETEQPLSDLCYESDGVYVAAAEYNSVNYYSVAAAIAVAGDANLADITLLNGCTTVPAGYYINDGAVAKCPAAIVYAAGDPDYYNNVQAAVNAANGKTYAGDPYEYVAVYANAAVTTAMTLKIKPMNEAVVTVSVPGITSEYALNDETDENGVVTYTIDPASTDYTWVAASGVWDTTAVAPWRYDVESTPTQATRAPSGVDNVAFASAADVTVGANVSVSTMTVGSAITLTKSSADVTVAATTGGIVLTDVGASITVSGVTLSPTPTTSVANYHVVNNAGVYTVAIDQFVVTIPSVANTTVSVSYTSGGVSQTATAAGAISVDYGTSLTATWTAVSGYQITANAEQTINPVVAAQTLTSPTVEEMSAAVSNVNFTYGADYTTAEVTATITGEATSATLTYGGNTYNAQVSNGTATFTDVAVSRDSGNIYAPVSYIITTDAHATTGGSGSAVVADTTTGWINENATTTGTSAGGSWSNTVTYTDGVATITNNRFTATSPSTSSRVVMEFNVCFTATSDENVTGEAQGALKLGEVNSVPTFMVLASNSEWEAVSHEAFTPNPATTYKVVMTFDYATDTYSVSVADNVLTNGSGSASFPLVADRSGIQTIDFAGMGTLESMKGDQLEGYMVKDALGNFYATIQAAINAYNSANGPYTVLHDGTAPSGWKIDNTTKALIKAAMGTFFFLF